MSTDQTTPPPASATLGGVRGTAEPAEAAIEAAAVELPGTEPADSDPIVDPAGHHDASSTGEHPAGTVGEHPAGSVGEHPAGTVGAHATGSVPTGPAVPATGPARQPAGSSWQAEASGRLAAMSFPGARRIAGWLFWVVFPLLCIVAIQTSVSNVVDHLGNKPTGIRGTFVVQPRSCSQGFCSFGGLFTSDDHTIKNLPLLGDPRWHTADVLRVTYDPRSVEVIALPGHWDPTPSVMAAIGALTYLVLLGYFVREQRRAGRPWRRLASSA